MCDLSIPFPTAGNMITTNLSCPGYSEITVTIANVDNKELIWTFPSTTTLSPVTHMNINLTTSTPTFNSTTSVDMYSGISIIFEGANIGSQMIYVQGMYAYVYSVNISNLNTGPSGFVIGVGIVRSSLGIIPSIITNSITSNVVTIPDIIIITAYLSNVTGQLLETLFAISDGLEHKCGLGEYFGYTQKINKTTTNMFVSNFNLNDAMIGTGSLEMKLTELNLDSSFVTYALLKAILGRLVFHELELKWLFRSNYNKLLKAVNRSIYKGYIPYLEANVSFEVYFV